MPTIFLSYARQDAMLVQTLVTDLRELDNTVWIDEQVSGGQDWWDHILEQIRACDVFIYALSPAALGSRACQRESEYAAALGKPVLPIWLAGEEPRNRLTPELAKIHYVDYREQTRDTSLRLARALNSMPKTPPLPEMLPAPPEAPVSYLNQLAAQVTGDAPLTYETQSALVLELSQSLTNPEMAEDARALLADLRGRRDLLARTATAIDKTLAPATHEEVRSKGQERQSRLRTILLTAAGTLLCLGLAIFIFSETLVAFKVEPLRQKLMASEHHIQTLEAKLTQAQQALAEEKGVRQKAERDREKLQQRVSVLQAQSKANGQDTTSKIITSTLPGLYENSIGMTFVLIPEGTFQMGSYDGQSDEQPVHQVTISQPFYLGQFEVTQAQWNQVMGSDTNRSEVIGDELPVTHVSWHDAQKFMEQLNAKEGVNAYRLPTEAEWEYAARAGTTMAYSFSNDSGLLATYGWYIKNSDNQPRAVGQLQANPWGLYDMHGNVWEWVQDWYADQYPSGHQTNPEGPKEGQYRVLRGGSFAFPPEFLRSARRVGVPPGFRNLYDGFRCVRVPPALNP